MPYKLQNNCYRTFDGIRWPNFCDVGSDEDEAAIADAKKFGARFKMRKHPEGYYQAFIHPDDFAAWAERCRAALSDEVTR